MFFYKIKGLFIFSINIVVIIKGIAKPKEYKNSNKAPFMILPVVLANMRADDKNAPTQGVHDKENIIPKNIELNKFNFFYLV